MDTTRFLVRTRARILSSALLILFGAAPLLVAQEPGDDTASIDITAEVIRLNSEQAGLIAQEWRQGHVTPRVIAESKSANENGYRVQLPASGPLPTPTYDDGRIYISGGFDSKEFYCLDAQSGTTLWAVDLDDDGPSAAVVERNVVVFNTESCTIFALDATTGEHLWSWWLGDPLMSTPTIHQGRVYTSYPNTALGAEATHVLACFELTTGKVLWQKWIDSDVMSAPVGAGDDLLVSSFAGTLYTFDAETGDIKSALRSRATSAPIVVDGELYFTQRADRDGQVREGVVRANRAEIDRAVADNTSVRADSLGVVMTSALSSSAFRSLSEKEAVYLDKDVQSNADYKAQAMTLDAANGFGNGAPQTANAFAAAENIGQDNVSSLQAFQGSRVLHADGRNFNTMGDEIICIDPESGEEIWTRKLDGDMERSGGFLGTSPVAVGGELIVCTIDGKVMRIDAASGEPIATYEIGEAVRTQPAVVDGRIYVGTEAGGLHCIDTKNRKLTGWYTWGGDMAHTGVGE